MTTRTRILAMLAILAFLGVPHAITAPTAARADLCTACADPDEPEVMLFHLPAGVYAATEGSTHHEQAGGRPR